MQTIKEKLIAELLVYLEKEGITKSEAARQARMDPHDFGAVFRLDRAVSLNKLQSIGQALGLEINMEWRKKWKPQASTSTARAKHLNGSRV